MKKIVALFIVQALLLAGCSNLQTDKEKIYKFLEEIVALEEDFALQQQPLADLEKEESEVYNQIIQQPASNKEEISKLSEEGLAIIDQKELVISIEKSSMEKSREKFEEIDKLISKVDNSNVQKTLEEMKSTMTQRYEQYDEVNKVYTEILLLEKDLYGLFLDPNLSLEMLEQQITTINTTYNQISELNAKFNELTQVYNDKKLSLYEQLDIEINQ